MLVRIIQFFYRLLKLNKIYLLVSFISPAGWTAEMFLNLKGGKIKSNQLTTQLVLKSLNATTMILLNWKRYAVKLNKSYTQKNAIGSKN